MYAAQIRRLACPGARFCRALARPLGTAALPHATANLPELVLGSQLCPELQHSSPAGDSDTLVVVADTHADAFLPGLDLPASALKVRCARSRFAHHPRHSAP